MGQRWDSQNHLSHPPPETRPAAGADDAAGMAWWNSLPERARACWLRIACSAVPADAWAAFKRAGAAGDER